MGERTGRAGLDTDLGGQLRACPETQHGPLREAQPLLDIGQGGEDIGA